MVVILRTSKLKKSFVKNARFGWTPDFELGIIGEPGNLVDERPMANPFYLFQGV
jgi:hypothetical protein